MTARPERLLQYGFFAHNGDSWTAISMCRFPLPQSCLKSELTKRVTAQ